VTLLERGSAHLGNDGRHHGQLHAAPAYAVRGPRDRARVHRGERNSQKDRASGDRVHFGLFVALTREDEDYCSPFSRGAKGPASGPIALGSRGLQLRPEILNPSLRFAVQGARRDHGRFSGFPSISFATARHKGADFRTFSEVVGIEVEGSGVRRLRVRDHGSGSEYTLAVDAVVNAAGCGRETSHPSRV